jgi:hypothetical protein
MKQNLRGKGNIYDRLVTQPWTTTQRILAGPDAQTQQLQLYARLLQLAKLHLTLQSQ